MDIYLLDQLLKGRIRPGMTIFDAGCGGGRNLTYFLAQGYAVRAVDHNAEAVDRLSEVEGRLEVRCEAIEEHSFPRPCADVVIVSAVLHFARDEGHFHAMLAACWEALRPGGLWFSRLASDIGLEGRFVRLEGRRFRLLDGSDRFLVDRPFLMAATDQLGGELLEPLKTTVVDEQRCMTTWVVRKNA
ncbi:MAG: class I SAM-dependent methyltransferase [Acidobacteriota bacterium]